MTMDQQAGKWRARITVIMVALMGLTLTGGCGEATVKWETILTASHEGVQMSGFLNPSFGVGITSPMDDETSFIDVSRDGGKKWARAGQNTAMLFGLEVLDETTSWSCGAGAQIWKSLDGAKSWQRMGDFGQAGTINQSFRISSVKPKYCKNLSFIDPQNGWIAGPLTLGMTRNGGESWQEIKLPAGLIEIDAIALRTANEGYLLDAEGSGHLYVTKDGGKNWSSSDLKLKGEKIPNSLMPMAAMRFTDAQNGIIVINRKGGLTSFLVTQDGGKSWQDGEIPVKMLGALFLTPDGKILTITGLYGDILVVQRS
jgi:photosystem II stability/assembly factor-like uncharacterized protein